MTVVQNTSATGGYLIPFTPAPIEDGGFDQSLQPILAGITGLDPSLVRRKWQGNDGSVLPNGSTPAAPRNPEASVTWCAFGAVDESADANPSFVHNPLADGGLGTVTSLRGEEASIMVSFYGPDAASYAAGLRDGFGIEQNREAMQLAGVAFVRVERITKVPSLMGSDWVRQVDFVFRVRRTAARTYRIRNVVGISGQVQSDTGTTSGL